MTAPHAVIVGSGIAGLTTALHAVRHGCRVTLVTKDELEHANTRYAQGGIAGVMFADDRVEAHVHDTLVAGAGLGDEEAVRVLATEGPARIQELIDLGVAFDRDADGDLVKGLEAAHSYPRILHAGGDATGAAIEKALVSALRNADVTVIEHAFLVDLVQQGDSRVVGVDLLVAGQRVRIDATAVVLATGGAGQLYAHTTNPPVATGDGIAAALRAGAVVRDLEFVQFHPTVLPDTPDAAAFLVSEAVRGEGAVLRDTAGVRFMTEVHPDAELAPRDVVARAIAERMASQGGAPVVLDATALRSTTAETARFLAQRFPTIDAAVRARDADWSQEPIPVTPAAHYLMGGVKTDLDGRTSLPGLYAVGEVACTGVHGANRLASNSLLEGAVFGVRAAAALATEEPRTQDGSSEPVLDVPALDDPAEPGNAASGFTRAALQQLMWRDAGLHRSEAGLHRAATTVSAWLSSLSAPCTEAQHEDANLLTVAAAVIEAARARRGSVGAHFRTDDPASAVISMPHQAAASSPSARLPYVPSAKVSA